MLKTLGLALVVTAVGIGAKSLWPGEPSLGSFADATGRFGHRVPCSDTKVVNSDFRGRVYECRSGPADGTLLTISERDNSGEVWGVEIAWSDDGFDDETGTGASEARVAADWILQQYAPSLRDETMTAFVEGRQALVEAGGLFTTVDHRPGSEGVERRILIAPSRWAPDEAPPVRKAVARKAKPVVGALGAFESAVRKFDAKLNCGQRSAQDGNTYLGALYGCVSGGARTAKVYVNGQVRGPGVANVKVMWNDYHYDAGYGVHADRHAAAAMLDAVLLAYVPSQLSKGRAAFGGTAPRTFSSNGLRVDYRFTGGPSADERLLTITAIND